MTGEPMAGIPSWARLNSGVMVHSQSPLSMARDQEWPVSLEFQFLCQDSGGGRQTGNACTPGTHIELDGARTTAHGRARFAEATQRIYGAPPRDWDGLWTLVIVPPMLKTLRDGMRDELLWLGFGQITPGVFAHPTHEESVIRTRLEELQSSGQLIVMQGSLLSDAASASLVSMGWDLGDLARRYKRFIDMFSPVAAALQGVRTGAVDGDIAFILRTLLLHEYRKVHLRDPLLPAALLPEDWAGTSSMKGKFSRAGKLPSVPSSVTLHKGWFDSTIPPFASQNPDKIAFLHVDCDIYSSTKCIFDQLGDRLQVGSVILFDEYFNYPNWQEHEFKAFQELVAATGLEYEYLGYCIRSPQAAVRITKV